MTLKDPGADKLSVWSRENVEYKKTSVVCKKQKIHTTVSCSYPVMGCQQMLNTMESECLFDVMVQYITTLDIEMLS